MRSLWMDPEYVSFQSLRGTLHVDVAIIGGGFSGLGAAWALRETGVTTALLEERTIASGASGRNAGFVLAGPAMPHHHAVRLLGADEASRIWQLTLDNNHLLAGIVESLAIDCGYMRRGSVSLAASEEEWNDIVAGSDLYSAAGISVCLVKQRELPKPFDRTYFGGIYYPGNAELNPGVFCRALASHLSDAVQIHEGTRVIAAEYDKDWVLHTENGDVRAGIVIVATNGYTDRLIPGMAITAIRGQVAATVPVGRVIVPFPMYASYGFQYWRQTEEGRLVVGGWRDFDIDAEVGHTETLNAQIQATLDGFMTHVLGTVATVEHRWAGIMGFTPDHFPLVGRVQGKDGLFIAAGYSGQGVSMAFECGRRVAEFATTGNVSIPPAFRPDRF